MSSRDIVSAFEEIYGSIISSGLICQVTNAVIEQVVELQNRPLYAVYSIVYLDCIVPKTRQDKRVINKLTYLVLGINIDALKELLVICFSEN
jgi:putative transposase